MNVVQTNKNVVMSLVEFEHAQNKRVVDVNVLVRSKNKVSTC